MRIPNVQNNNDNECTRNRWAATQIPSPRHDGCFFLACNKSCPARKKRWTFIKSPYWKPKMGQKSHWSSYINLRNWFLKYDGHPSELNPEKVIMGRSLKPGCCNQRFQEHEGTGTTVSSTRNFHHSSGSSAKIWGIHWVLRVGARRIGRISQAKYCNTLGIRTCVDTPACGRCRRYSTHMFQEMASLKILSPRVPHS